MNAFFSFVRGCFLLANPFAAESSATALVAAEPLTLPVTAAAVSTVVPVPPAVWQDAPDHAPAVGATEKAAGTPAVMEHFLPEEELAGLLREFEKHGEKLDRGLTEGEEIQAFARFFQAMKQALMNVGTFSEGGTDDEADFISWPQMDPSRIMRVRARVGITREMAQVVLAACTALGSEHAVVFDGKEGRCVVFSNGDWCRED